VSFVPPQSPKKRDAKVLVQVKISRRAATLLRKRAKSAVRTQASYLRAVIYRDLGLLDKVRERVTGG
jgi:lipoprotein NlpI